MGESKPAGVQKIEPGAPDQARMQSAVTGELKHVK